MKRLDLARLSLAGDLSGGKGRQMAALSRQCGIGLRKGSLDEEEVGISSKPYDGLATRNGVGDISNISNLLAGRHRERGAQGGKR